MYSSNSFYASNYNNNENLTSPSYTLGQSLPDNPYICEIDPNSTHRNPLHTPWYFNIPSPYNLYETDDVFVQVVNDLYLQQRSQITGTNTPDPIRTEMVEHSMEILGECSSKQNENLVVKEIPQKKTSKKNRHSKIGTAQGPRDRRVRLSLQVAREFFDLQDSLGYNRASRTVEWLISNSKAAIKDLSNSSANSPSSTFACEIVSQEKEKHLVSPSKETKNMKGPTRKSTFNPLAKESREKARARARERTKIKVDGLKIGSETKMINQMNPLGSWFQNQNNCSQLEVFNDIGAPSSSAIFSYHRHNNGISQEHQIIDCNLHGKSWDVYDNLNQG